MKIQLSHFLVLLLVAIAAPVSAQQPELFSPGSNACEGNTVEVSAMVRDTQHLATHLLFFDKAPDRSDSRLIGTFPIEQAFRATLYDTTTFWVVGQNRSVAGYPADTLALTINVNPYPSFLPLADHPVCSGELVRAPIFRVQQGNAVFIWSNDDMGIGLPDFGVGQLPSFRAPQNTSTQTRHASITVYAIAHGCASVEQFDFVLHPIPYLAPGFTDTICSKEPLALFPPTTQAVPGGITYRWNAPQLASGLQGSASGGAHAFVRDSLRNFGAQAATATFDVTAVGPTGCAANAVPITVSVRPEPVIRVVPPNPVCSRTALRHPFSVQHNLPGLRYNWQASPLPTSLQRLGGNGSGSDPTVTDSLENRTAATATVHYQLEATSGAGCEADAVSIQLDITPWQPLQLDTVQQCETLASSHSAVFDLAPLSFDAFYADSLLSQPLAKAPIQSTDRTLYAITNRTIGCPDRTALHLSVAARPAPPASQAADICRGQVVSLKPAGSPGATFSFFDADPNDPTANLLSQGTSTYRFSPSDSTTLHIVELGEYCTSFPTPVPVAVRPTPTLLLDSVGLICTNTTLRLNATTDATQIQWTGPGGFSSTQAAVARNQATIQMTGVYRTVATGTNGCVSQDSVWVQVIPAPDMGQDTIALLCSPTQTVSLRQFLPDAPGGGVWSGPTALGSGDSGSWEPHYPKGIYSYTASLQAPCPITQTLRVTVDEGVQPEARAAAALAVDQYKDLALTALGVTSGFSYHWVGPGGFSHPSSQTILPVIRLEEAGTYRLIVRDAKGCVDSAITQVSVTPVSAVKLELKAFLEGPFDETELRMRDDLRTKGLLPVREPYTTLGIPLSPTGSNTLRTELLQKTGDDAPVDWVIVALLDAQDLTRVVARRPFLLQRDGDVVLGDGETAVSFPGVAPGSYYVSIWHRNHLATRSPQPIQLGLSAVVVNFGDAAAPAESPIARRIVGNHALMWGGDANGDGQIQLIDQQNWVKQVGRAGYLEADFNLDGEVRNDDNVIIWENNSGRGTPINLRQ